MTTTDLFDPARHREITEQFLIATCAILRRNIREKKATQAHGAVTASGDLARSVRYAFTDGSWEIYAAGYAFAAEMGRKPGARPPVGDIRKWIDVKGLDITLSVRKDGSARQKVTGKGPDGKRTYRDRTVEDEKDSVAWAIATSIAKKGTVIHQEGAHSGVLREAIAQERLATLRVDLAGVLAADISSYLLGQSLS